jgi:hypothetical protein
VARWHDSHGPWCDEGHASLLVCFIVARTLGALVRPETRVAPRVAERAKVFCFGARTLVALVRSWTCVAERVAVELVLLRRAECAEPTRKRVLVRVTL